MSAGNPSSTNLVAPQSSSVEAPAASPTTSVKRLLADTSAAAPARDSQHSSPSTNDSGAAQQPSLGQPGPNGPDPSSSGFSHAQHKRVGTDHPEPQPAKSRGTATAEKPTFQQTLADLRAFLMPFLKLLPFSASLQAQLKRFIGPPIRVVVRCLAWLLHRFDFGLASNLAYDVHILLWKWVINLFFREIRPRGAYRVPREGPVIFVCGPHHNQASLHHRSTMNMPHFSEGSHSHPCRPVFTFDRNAVPRPALAHERGPTFGKSQGILPDRREELPSQIHRSSKQDRPFE